MKRLLRIEAVPPGEAPEWVRQYAWNSSTGMPALRLKNDSAFTMVASGGRVSEPPRRSSAGGTSRTIRGISPAARASSSPFR